MGSLYPFTGRLNYIQRQVVAMIQSPQFHFALPEISRELWREMQSSRTLTERLEFLGDALMHSSITDGLSELFPDEGPGFYTHVRSVLEANSTFAHLMIKVGYTRTGHPVKAAGDIFESIMAAFHREQGSEVFKQYIWKSFKGLIERAGQACTNYQSMHPTRPIIGPLKNRPRALNPPKLHLQRRLGHGKKIERKLTTSRMLQRKLSRKASATIGANNLPETLKISEVIDLSDDTDSDVEMTVAPIWAARPPSTVETQASSSKLEDVVPGYHANSLGTGTGFLPRPTKFAMTKNIPAASTSTKVEDSDSDDFLPRPSQPLPVLSSASTNSGPSISRPRTDLTRQFQKASNKGSIENPIVID